MADETTTRIFNILDDHGKNIVRLDQRVEDVERRLDIVEGMPKSLEHVRSTVDQLKGQMSIMLWLFFAIAGGFITMGFALLRGGEP